MIEKWVFDFLVVFQYTMHPSRRYLLWGSSLIPIISGTP